MTPARITTASSPRRRAWRNLTVAACNAALERQLFRFDNEEQIEPVEFTFMLAGRPVEALVWDAGFGEVSILAIFDPNPSCSFRTQTPLRAAAGAASVRGWVERRTGRWLQNGGHLFKTTRAAKDVLTALRIEPVGYADHGKFFL